MHKPVTIDINCDLGEEIMFNGQPVEPMIMPLITSANIACGKHAGNEKTIEDSVLLAREYGVAVGAHPSYDDRAGFGRNYMALDHDNLRVLVLEQITSLQKIAGKYNIPVVHVKPHGALYNAAATNPHLADAIAEAVKHADSTLTIFGMPGSELHRASEKHKLPFAAEAFADRAYNLDGTLTDRKIAGAVIHNIGQIVEQTLSIIKDKKVKTLSGKWINLQAHTICIHGDNPIAPEILKALHSAFSTEGITIQRFVSQDK